MIPDEHGSGVGVRVGVVEGVGVAGNPFIHGCCCCSTKLKFSGAVRHGLHIQIEIVSPAPIPVTTFLPLQFTCSKV